MGTGQSSSSRKYTYEEYYNALKTQNGGSMRNVALGFDQSTLDPYEVLGVTRTSTWDELKRSYRNSARKTHPDMGGSEELFQIVTESFRKVAYDYQMRVADRPHHELKANAQSYYADRPNREIEPSDDEYGGSGGNSADFQARFNQAFDKHRLEDDDTSRGYADMMEKSDPKRPEVSIDRKMKGYSADKFNQLFEKEVPVRKDMVVYKEPEPLIMAKKLAFTELGVKTEDFSSTGEGGERRSLQYTDYMKAHTTSRLVDPKLVKDRPVYKNVEAFEAARARTIAKPMSSREQERIDKKKRQEELIEEERLRRLRERDDAIARHHENVNRLAIKPF